MEDMSIKQYYIFQMEEKRRIDEYSCLLEDTVQNVRSLRLRGESRLAYIRCTYQEHKKRLCQNVPEQKFLSAVLLMVNKRKF